MGDVISILDRKKVEEKKESQTTSEPEISQEEYFKKLEELNKKNKERMAKQRLQDNKSVKRSYRLPENT